MGSSRKERRPVCSTRRKQVLCRAVTASLPWVFACPMYATISPSAGDYTWTGIAVCFISFRCGKRETVGLSELDSVVFIPASFPFSYSFFISTPVPPPLLNFLRVDSFFLSRLIHSSPCLSCSLLSRGSVMYASICVDYLSFPTTTIPHSRAVTQT